MWDSAGSGAVLVQEVKVTKGLCGRPGKSKKASRVLVCIRPGIWKKKKKHQDYNLPPGLQIRITLMPIRFCSSLRWCEPVTDHWFTYRPFRPPFFASTHPLWYGSPQASKRLHFEPLKLLSFDFRADPDTTLYSNADPDTALYSNADPDPTSKKCRFGIFRNKSRFTVLLVRS